MTENQRAGSRVPPIIHAYLNELAALGIYGEEGKSGVVRRFIERGIEKAIKDKLIARKNANDFKGAIPEREPED